MLPRIERAQKWWAAIAATGRVLGDSNRIADIHLVSEITSAHRFAQLLAQERDRQPAVLRERPELNYDTVDLDALRALPADTLGGAYARHLDRNRLELYVDQTSDRFVEDPDVRYLIHRYRQTHDIWHVLIGLGTRGHEEVLVHAFSYGALRLPISALIMFFGTLKHIVFEKRWSALRHDLLDAYQSGRDAKPLLTEPWEQMWTDPIHDVRARYRIRPLRAG